MELNIRITFLCITVFGSKVVSVSVVGPKNVRITSLNMGLILEWDATPNATNISYTAQFKSFYSDFQTVCLNTKAHSCDFTSHLSPYGEYTYRVKAQTDGYTSDWVNTTEFTLDKNTTIGPCTVSLMSRGPAIEVSIEDPVFRLSNLGNVFSYFTYNITYWEDSPEGKVEILSDIQQDRLVLSGLKILTTYCVQVQILIDRFSKHSQLSNITCESTTEGEPVPWMEAVVTFVLMAVIVILIVLGVSYRRKIIDFLRPKDKLPQHIKEYLLDPNHSSKCLDLQSSPLKEVCHQVSLMVEQGTDKEELSLKDGTAQCSQTDNSETSEALLLNMNGLKPKAEMGEG